MGTVRFVTAVEIVLVLLVCTSLLAVLANRINIAYPIVLVLGGLLLGFVPGLPRVILDPSLVFTLFLPPLLYAAAWFMPWTDFCSNIRPILMLAFGLVIATAAAVAVAAEFLIGLPLAAGFVLGAIVSPPDAVAATSVAQRLHLPKRIVTVLEGESLINDAAGLTLLQVAVAAVVTGKFSAGHAALDLLLTAGGGTLFGLAVGAGATWLQRRIRDPMAVVVLTLLTPFACYLPAEHLHLSGVLATVSAGLYGGSRASGTFAPTTRVRALFVWEAFIFLLNGLVFILIGLQLPVVLEEISGQPWPRLLLAAVVISAVVILVRIAWVLPATLVTRLVPVTRGRSATWPWSWVTVISWAGMRGIVSLAAALSLPELTSAGAAFPERSLILFLAFSVILATLVLQGLTLPPLIRRLDIREETHEREEEVEARRFAIEAALARLGTLAVQADLSPPAVELLRARYRYMLRVLDDGDTEAGDLGSDRLLEQEAIGAERHILEELRRVGVLSEEIFRRLEHELDLRVARLGV